LATKRILQRAADEIGLAPVSFDVVIEPSAGPSQPGQITLIDLGNALPESCPVGQLSAASGKAAVEYVLRACDLAVQNQVDRLSPHP